MFYSHDVLQRKGGKFGIIWIAATRGVHLTRREYYGVNVDRTCRQIIDYITLRARPVRPGGSVPRFSLYLSSQLMFGVVKVYNRQTEYLYSDLSCLSKVFSHLSQLKPTTDIDLKVTARADPVTSTEGVIDGNYDLDFGALRWEQETLSLQAIADEETFRVELTPPFASPFSSPEHRDISIPLSPNIPQEPFRPGVGAPLTSPKERITLQEEVSFSEEEMKLPDEKDLPLFTGEELPMLDVPEKELSAQIEASILAEQQGVAVFEEIHSASESELRADMPVPTETTPTVGVTGHRQRPGTEPTPGVTPGTPRREEPKRRKVSIGLELSPLTPTPGSRRRKRQLIFADKEIQIHKKKLKQQMADTTDIMRPLMIPSPTPHLSAVELLTLPSRKDIRSRNFLPLWRRCANTLTTEGSDSDIEKRFWTISSDEDAVSTVPELSPIPEPRDSLQQEKEESMEIARLSASASKSASRLELLRSFIEQSSDLDVSSDTGSRSGKRPRLSADRSADKKSRASPIPEMETISAPPSRSIRMPPVLEEEREEHHSSMDELLDLDMEARPEKSAKIVHEDVLRILLHLTANVDMSITFRTLCPPASNTRSQAAGHFTAILDLCALNKIDLTQEEPYGDIFITRGTEW
ncbi:meiotic recombination protein REC8 homolog [Lingula anatina]|uniref:Meiotic recombination protein REC8 homolog n=1 Tax=Lingula anatina TaxID=7574 RepID=A0A2R2MPL3_LINAN|nr:meiotic recombination protein REC8 homolog [Lingula anatina]|eukprot:XP_023932118.1 meiotic recombination protein REC8 homolog [Lingula anatina]